MPPHSASPTRLLSTRKLFNVTLLEDTQFSYATLDMITLCNVVTQMHKFCFKSRTIPHAYALTILKTPTAHQRLLLDAQSMTIL